MCAPTRFSASRSLAGFSIIESAIAATIIAIFLGGMFTANSMYMGLLRNAKDSAAAMLSNQQRVEELRSCNWSEVTDSVYWSDNTQPSFWTNTNSNNGSLGIMTSATQSGASLSNASEVVTITEYGFLQSGESSACSFQVTRNSSGSTSFTSQNNPGNLVNSYLLKVDITLSWTTLGGGRSRSRSSSTVISQGGLIGQTPINPSIKW